MGKWRDLDHRPRGITLFAILYIISGVIIIGNFTTVFRAPIGFNILIIAMNFIAMIASFIIAFGLWTGKGWAWTATVTWTYIGIAFIIIITSFSLSSSYLSMTLPSSYKQSHEIQSAVANIFIINLIISLIFAFAVLYYMYKRHVKMYFSKTGYPPLNFLKKHIKR